MRCKACNVILTDYEATRKDKTGEYIDLCGQCYHPSNVTDDNEMLKHESDIVYTKELDSEN